MPDSPEVTFLRGYKDAVMHFNRLDRNLAYCLRWASIYAGADVGPHKFLSYSYDRKLKGVRALVKEVGLESEYASFIMAAEECRALRNKFVHGDWEFVPRLPNPIRFQVPEPFEEMGYLSLKEFSVQVALLQRTNSLFGALQKKSPLAPKKPNKAPEPTPPSVTVRAYARPAPAGVVAHL